MLNRRLFKTRRGKIGLGPLALTRNEIIFVLFGGTIPLVLRPYGDGYHYWLAGECYIHDIKHGQAIGDWQESGDPASDFHLVC